MFNHWRDFLDFREKTGGQNTETFTQSLLELEKQYHRDIMSKKLITEKRRLTKVLVEKQKGEYMSKERQKVTPNQDLFRFVPMLWCLFQRNISWLIGKFPVISNYITIIFYRNHSTITIRK